MSTKVITISRQFGSLGRYISRAVAEKMGYEYYDRDIIDKIAEEKGYDVSSLLNENTRMKKSIYGKMMYPLGNSNLSKQEKLYDIEKLIIKELAKEKNCVIVGRCANYILKNSTSCQTFNVFIYAPYTERYKFGINNFGLTIESLMDHLAEVDKARSIFYKRHTGESFESINYRDMLIDSSTSSIDNVSEMICYCARKKFKEI